MQERLDSLDARLAEHGQRLATLVQHASAIEGHLAVLARHTASTHERLAPLELHASATSDSVLSLRRSAGAITRRLSALDQLADQLLGLLTARLEHFERVSTLAFERCTRLETQLDHTNARVDGIASPPDR